ncbi:MAG: DivIVA domain-containing protein [Clostridia bacterium]|nr:DivIVA domain-containing protein [Clostridia bacterium]
MLNSKELKNIKFSKSMGGYKQEEVEILLDRIEADYEIFERTVRELQAGIENKDKEIAALKDSQSSIQEVLLSAQKLAEQIVNEAKQKSEEIVKSAEESIVNITGKQRDVIANFETEHALRLKKAEEEYNELIAALEARKLSVEKATEDCIERQQVLFNKLKLEVASFKAEISAKYKQHIELLSKLPDEVPMDPKSVAELITADVEKAPEVSGFVVDSSSVEETKEETEEVQTEEI